MTYDVFSGTLNVAHSFNHLLIPMIILLAVQ